MPDINDLRRARQVAATRMAASAEALNELEASDGATEEQIAAAQSEFDAARTAFNTANGAVQRAEAVETANGIAAAPAEPAAAVPGAGGTTPAVAAEPGLRFARMLRTVAAAGGNRRDALEIAEANGDSGLFSASQNATIGAAGAFLVPEDVAGEVIELLRPASVVLRMGVRPVPMPNGNLTQNRRATGASFGYGEEGDDIVKTGVTFGQMRLRARKLSGIIPISNDLLSQPSTAVDRLIRDDAVADAGLAMDRAFLRGSGSNSAPLGLRFQLVGTSAAATNILTMTATPDLQKIDTDLGKMELALANGNVVVTGAHWIMSPRTANHLRNLRDGNGNKAYPEMGDGKLRGKPYHETTEIPDNLGGGTESEIMLVNPTQVLVGETNGINIAMSSEAAYKDENNVLQSAFSRDETLLRMIMQHDIGLRHLVAVSILTGVTWGV